MIKVAFIVPDNRDKMKRYSEPRPIIGYAPQALLDGFAQIGGCEVHVISMLKKRVQCPPKLAENIFYHGLYLPFGAWFRTLYATALFATRRRIRAIGANIAHGQGSETFAALGSSLSGIPNVLTLHGIMTQIAKFHQAPPSSYMGITAKLERFSVRRANGVVCLSSHTKRAVEVDARKTWIVPNAVDERFFKARREPGALPEILCVGQIYALKNQIALIRALKPLAAALPFQVTFFGRVLAEAEVEFSQLLRENPWCKFEGFADSETMKARMANAAMLVHPTLEDNCPMVILEAMAAGLPIAASRIGGVPDLIEDGVTGILFDPSEPAQMSAAVERILREPALAARFSEAGRHTAEVRFRPRAVAARHLEIYREVLKR